MARMSPVCVAALDDYRSGGPSFRLFILVPEHSNYATCWLCVPVLELALRQVSRDTIVE